MISQKAVGLQKTEEEEEEEEEEDDDDDDDDDDDTCKLLKQLDSNTIIFQSLKLKVRKSEIENVKSTVGL